MKKDYRLYLFWLIGGALLLSSCGKPIECRKIAFSMFNFQDETQPDIYSVCPDGSSLTQLTNDPNADTHPAWSPDGKELAFVSDRAGCNHIFVMDAAGGDPVQKTFDLCNDMPIWLPDGTQIAFRTTDSQGLWWWRITNLENNEITQFSEPLYDFFFQTPAWSPDGEEIAYMSLVEQVKRNDGSSQIHIKNVDGTEDTALTSNIWANINPIWSPDGQKIAFLSEQGGEYNIFSLYIMDKDGKNVKKLSNDKYTETALFSWSPDARQIAISDKKIGHIYIIDIYTGNARELSVRQKDGDTAYAPSWQP